MNIEKMKKLIYESTVIRSVFKNGSFHVTNGGDSYSIWGPKYRYGMARIEEDELVIYQDRIINDNHDIGHIEVDRFQIKS